MSNRTLKVDDRLYEYILKVSLREPSVLRLLREETAAMPEHNMQIAPEQGQFMALLAKFIGARRCLEVGTFTGYSSLAVALVLPDDGVLVTCDTSKDYTAVARRYWEEAGVTERIDLRLGPALDTLDALADEEGQARSYDFAFIDADKENYAAYYERCLNLMRTGGVIAFDNTLWGGAVADESDTEPDTIAIRELNEQLYADERVDISLVPIGDGLTLCRKR